MNAPDNNQEPANAPWDPVFLESRREALVILLLWVAALLWAVPYCYLNGFPETFVAEEFSTVWGIPSWLFWGIAVPWLLADVFTLWFCFFYMKDGDLGEEAPVESQESA
tara:strand:+ start:1365 stop:1691 length:327 start_codon:yes stop_codon:yes gene_type:complete